MTNFKPSNTHPHLGLKKSDQAPKDFHFHGLYGCIFHKFLIMPTKNFENVCMFLFLFFSALFSFSIFSLAVEVVFVETQELFVERVKGDWC